MLFGKGAGCQFFTNDCTVKNPNRDEWCTVGSNDACTISLKGRGRCRVDKYADGCSFVREFSNGLCKKKKYFNIYIAYFIFEIL